MKCPKCGSEDYDDDWREVVVEDGIGDPVWWEEHWFVCGDCGHEEKVKDGGA